jgi:hypothetical protein
VTRNGAITFRARISTAPTTTISAIRTALARSVTSCSPCVDRCVAWSAPTGHIGRAGQRAVRAHEVREHADDDATENSDTERR